MDKPTAPHLNKDQMTAEAWPMVCQSARQGAG